MDSIWPARKRLDHAVPGWAQAPEFFITICCQKRNENQLCRPEVAEAVFDSAKKLSHLQLWDCELLLLMPDHLHLLVGFSARQEMPQVIARWKRWLAWKRDLKFQSGFFDHRLRSIASACEKWTYIHGNPVRHGLIKNPDEWPYRWTRQHFDSLPRSACKADPTQAKG
jgi:putative transposase